MVEKKKNLSDISSDSLPDAAPFRFAILVSEWNKEVTGALLKGAIETLIANGARKESIITEWVPGSYELPQAAALFARNNIYDAVICIGCVVQGETRHFDFICSAVAQGCMNVSVSTHTPVVFGVLTTNTMQQALDRSGGKHGNKGVEAAAAAISMAHLRAKYHK